MTPFTRGLVYAGIGILATTVTFTASHAAPKAAASSLVLKAFETKTEAVWDDETQLAYTDLDAYLVNGDQPVEFRVRRPAYDKPVEATLSRGPGTPEVAVPAGMLTDLNRLPKFFDLTVTDSRGGTVVQRQVPLCLNGADTRLGPDGPPANPYPEACKANPFGLSNLWGMPRRWALMPFLREENELALPLRRGARYDVALSVTEPYRELLGIADADAALRVAMEVVEPDDSADPTKNLTPLQKRKLKLDGPPGEQPGTVRRPTGPQRVPSNRRLLPDMRALPAWDLSTTHGTTADGVPDRDMIKFGSTVWIDGDAPLHVQGFREDTKPLMKAYQYFLDSAGNEVGYVEVGGMEWDPRPLHLHWHFQDFAGYRLLHPDGSPALQGTKEAFCIANTDQVDMLGAHAVHRPGNLGLRVDECGGEFEMEVQQRLDVGWGDTYGPERPDQEFDITDLPNGTYQLEIRANPNGNLHEKDVTNNASLRTVTVGGRKGARTVSVPPVGMINYR